MKLRIQHAQLSDPHQASATVEIVDSYARGPGGQNAPLDDLAKNNMVEGLSDHPMARVYLAFADDRAVGVAICMWGFSTFAGKPSVNVHDLAVLPEFQNRGIGRALLDEVEREARERGCCKVTLPRISIETQDLDLGIRRHSLSRSLSSSGPPSINSAECAMALAQTHAPPPRCLIWSFVISS
jgi:GNAT superfamily N-acetyltransferase